MKLYDKHHRVIAELSLRRLQIGKFYVERQHMRVHRGSGRYDENFQVVFGWSPNLILDQPELRQCQIKACGRWVRSPCNSAQGYHESGPWDSWCRDLVR